MTFHHDVVTYLRRQSVARKGGNVRYLVFIFVSALLLTGCGKKSDETANDTKMTPVDQNANQLLLTASSRLIDKFGKELKTELMSALSEGGAVSAISVCQVKAPEISAANSGEFWNIRRVSDRNRNQDNLANELETAILARFSDTVGIIPEFVAEWNDTDSGKVYRHYRPIRLATMCVKCHGTAEDIDDTVAAALAEKYPADRAIGYRPGDIRGMFIVEIRWPEGKVFADSIAAMADSEVK